MPSAGAIATARSSSSTPRFTACTTRAVPGSTCPGMPIPTERTVSRSIPASVPRACIASITVRVTASAPQPVASRTRPWMVPSSATATASVLVPPTSSPTLIGRSPVGGGAVAVRIAFTAPATSPPVMRRCTMRRRRTTAIEVSVEPAITAPQSVASVADRNEFEPDGEASGDSFMITSANMNSFHAWMKAKTPVETSPGASSGKVTRQNAPTWSSRRSSPPLRSPGRRRRSHAASRS